MNAYPRRWAATPELLKRELRDRLPLHGAQRPVSLGDAADVNTSLAQDAIEPVRGTARWIVDESCP